MPNQQAFLTKLEILGKGLVEFVVIILVLCYFTEHLNHLLHNILANYLKSNKLSMQFIVYIDVHNNL